MTSQKPLIFKDLNKKKYCKINNNTFLIKKRKNSTMKYVEFYLGNKKCLTSTINYKENNKFKKIFNNTIQIQSFGYDKSCTITKNMQRGIGTDRMMFCFIHFIKQKFNNVKYIALTDNAMFYCKNIKIPMSTYYFYKYGKMYYSKKYGFKPIFKKNDEEKYKKFKKIYLDKNYVDKKFLDFFDMEIKNNLNKKEIREIREKLIEHKNIQSFLQNYIFSNCLFLKNFLDLLGKYYNIDNKLFFCQRIFIKNIKK